MTSNAGQRLYNASTIRNNLSLPDVIDRVEDAFRLHARDQTQMPAKNYLLFEEYDGDLRSMSAYIPSFDLSTVKVVNSHPGNPARHNLPTVMALIIAVHPETGYPVAVLDGTEITAFRTAAASAVATKLCTRPSVDSLGIIGAGAQANDQIRGQLIVRDFSSVYVYDVESRRANKLIENLKEEFSKISWTIADSVEALMEHVEVINSLTPSREPLIETENTRSIQHINAMGADGPGKQEWPIDLLTTCDIYVDEWEQARHSGEIHTALEQNRLEFADIEGTLGELALTDDHPEDVMTLFDSTGLAIQDTAATKALLESAVEADQTFPFLNTNI